MQQHQAQLRQQRAAGIIRQPGVQNQQSVQNQQLNHIRPALTSGKTLPTTAQQQESNGITKMKLDENKNKDKNSQLVEPTLQPPNPSSLCSKNLSLPLMSDSSDLLDVSEEDLKDLLSQKDLATTLAENLLKHFGSDDIDVKEEPTTGKYCNSHDS